MYTLLLAAFIFAQFSAGPIWWGLLVGLCVVDLRAQYRMYQHQKALMMDLLGDEDEGTKEDGTDKPS